jgi:small subunit ribosomal protein S20
MPITRSAKKALRQSATRRILNIRRKQALKTTIKKLRKLVTAKKLDEAKAMLPEVYKVADKTAKAGTIKKNAADRIKSRLTKLIETKTK